MKHQPSQENGRRNIGRRRSLIRSAAEIALDDRMRRRFIRLVKDNGPAPSRMVQEIVEGRHTPWRVPARRTLELMDAGWPTEDIKAVMIDEMSAWLEERAAVRELKPAA